MNIFELIKAVIGIIFSVWLIIWCIKMLILYYKD